MSGAEVARSVAAEVRGFAVTPDNIVQLRNALAEATLLSGKLNLYGPQMVVGEPGQDPVSPDAAKSFNAKVQKLSDGCWAYVHALQDAAEALH